MNDFGKAMAVTVAPGLGQPKLESVELPGPPDGLLIEMIAVGVCGTDHEILAGHHGSPPPGRDRMVLGHESLGRVVEGNGSGPQPGDLVAGIVRRPDPLPCSACAAGEWDMCTNGDYTERGIMGLDGFLATQVRVEPEYCVVVPEDIGALGVLVEPASIVAKAWEHTEAIGSRAAWHPERVLITGAGPIGLLAALMAVQRGFEVSVFDQVTLGPKPELVRRLGARYHVGDVAEVADGVDVVIECTGATELVIEVIGHTAATGIVCLTGVTSPGRRLTIDVGAVTSDLVLENDVVFGTVNANRRHYEAAVESLSAADSAWLSGLITRRVAMADWDSAYERRPDDVKVVVTPNGPTTSS